MRRDTTPPRSTAVTRADQKYFIRDYEDKDQEKARLIFIETHLAAAETMPEAVRDLYRVATKTEMKLGLTDIRQNYATEPNQFFIAAYGPDPDDIAGFCALSETDDQQAELKNLVVRPAYQGIGIARLLMDTFENESRQRGYRKATLWSYQYLRVATAMYQQRGWVKQLIEIPPGTSMELKPMYMELTLTQEA